jgi:hypothetical protein
VRASACKMFAWATSGALLRLALTSTPCRAGSMENGARPWTTAISTLIQVTLKCLVHSALKLGRKTIQRYVSRSQPTASRFCSRWNHRNEDSQSSCRSQQQLFESPTKKKTGRRNRISQFLRPKIIRSFRNPPCAGRTPLLPRKCL